MKRSVRKEGCGNIWPSVRFFQQDQQIGIGEALHFQVLHERKKVSQQQQEVLSSLPVAEQVLEHHSKVAAISLKIGFPGHRRTFLGQFGVKIEERDLLKNAPELDPSSPHIIVRHNPVPGTLFPSAQRKLVK